MTYGCRLKFIREFRGLTQKELAEKCNLGKHGHIFIAQYETEKRTPKSDRNECLAKALEVYPKMLMWDTDNPHEDMFFQLCWVFMFPGEKYSFTVSAMVLDMLQIFMDESTRFLAGEISGIEYVKKKFDAVKQIENE